MNLLLFVILPQIVIIEEPVNHLIEFLNKINVTAMMDGMDLTANFLILFGSKIIKKFLKFLNS